MPNILGQEPSFTQALLQSLYWGQALKVVLLIQFSVRCLAIVLVTTMPGLKHYSRIVAPIFSKVDDKVFGLEPDRIFVDFFDVLFSDEDLRELHFHLIFLNRTSWDLLCTIIIMTLICFLCIKYKLKESHKKGGTYISLSVDIKKKKIHINLKRTIILSGQTCKI